MEREYDPFYSLLDPKVSVLLNICHNILHGKVTQNSPTSHKNPFTAHGHESPRGKLVSCYTSVSTAAVTRLCITQSLVISCVLVMAFRYVTSLVIFLSSLIYHLGKLHCFYKLTKLMQFILTFNPKGASFDPN